MSHRIAKVNELLQQQLSLLIFEEFERDLGILTVTAVDTTHDLKNAKVYISTINEPDLLDVLDKLQNRAFKFQQQLAKRLTMKYIPKLEFIMDRSKDKIHQVEKLLNQIQSK